jgi:Bacterial Ig domain
VSGWNLGNLSLVPPKDFNGRIDLQVVASAAERANGSQASTTANLSVTVLAVIDAPLADDASVTVEKNGSVRIDVTNLVSDVDSNVLTLSTDNPDHGTLTRNADGTYTYTPKRGYTGIDGFSYSVSDGSLTATGWIDINVVRNYDCGASIVVHSNDPNVAPVTIDWNGTAGIAFMSLPVNQADWLPGFLGFSLPDPRSLAEITGLVVRV